ncbi:hypothetical protein NECAME_08373 [Necator americanus]|uniref:Uncharacterized protein n=1 Tax=Necator americanus TaxID=51031 RepID=W2TII9_NECAM|nr:hypothetical protein NECAME_08373 [Necator americanus]ETN81628.1 hypothetical protein NECAME_08373 [Necator americanus]
MQANVSVIAYGLALHHQHNIQMKTAEVLLARPGDVTDMTFTTRMSSPLPVTTPSPPPPQMVSKEDKYLLNLDFNREQFRTLGFKQGQRRVVVSNKGAYLRV